MGSNTFLYLDDMSAVWLEAIFQLIVSDGVWNQINLLQIRNSCSVYAGIYSSGDRLPKLSII